MKYRVMYDKGTRLRVRSGQWAFTKEEGYGLASLLLENDFIYEVYTSHRNGSILIYYDDVTNKSKIFNILDSITMDDLVEAEPSQLQASKEITEEFIFKLFKMIANRFFGRIFLPIRIKNILTLIRASKYIWAGLDSLTSFRIDVALLDGAAVAGALYMRDFAPASSMMFLLSISDELEEYTVQKAKSTLKDSLALNIDTLWVVTEDGSEEQRPALEVKKGDKIKIHMGDVIPVDGKVVDGEAMVNEASMTGEPLAVHKRPGKTVHAGTVIEEGNIIVEVFSINKETRLNKIIDLIENSEELKADAHSKAEKLADSIVPYSLLATALTYLFTGNATKALSVLMVDFSCAIKLTTPLSIISAMREASDNRMMVKGGKFLEKYATADTIVFDKTGTLTNASPKVVHVFPMTKRYTREEILRMAACIEEHFAHSIATAIVKHAEPLSSPYGSGCLSPAGNGLQPAFSIPSFVLCSVLAVSYVRVFRVVAIPQSGLLAQVRSFWLRVGRSCPILTKLCSPRLPRVPALPPLPSGGCRRLCCFSAGGVTVGLVICWF